MEFPLVSIIVPMYNTAGCIARCIKSICAQTYKSIEILLLNDGSTDDTLAICRALAASDHRIALVDKTNTGAADTRNQGIALAHGKYIQFVDSDDWLGRFYGKAGLRRRGPHRRSCDRTLLDGVPGKLCGAHSPMGKGAAACAPAQSAPHPGLWLSACRGVHRTGVRKASDPEAKHLLLWQSLQQALPP